MARAAISTRALSRLKVEHVTVQTAKVSAALLKDAGLHGHKYAIDATIAEAALRARACCRRAQR
ncbi:hypothetical protein ADZ36_17360 [Streptomyces fradiae]|uniref:Uncharacterized protein n=2 Tax=Streptomyces TaxID=1883 RepID=A0A3R7EL18_9ACTN|nr:hypothetical protein ADZ36_17360 [Streptomyces fradiae]OFA57870.1 hypothetical protein BEN35_04890 [Streptomyces fradiae]PQM23700.1 hypothetical protein Sfr7A_08695 [Streptomyces xinghaiensis]RKM91688.1 hypothetical protein SFRA_027215 [Streptomyces xinghaiensis]RNC73393.1 hypothetical protein DC095_014815 [Streptomyces xinghaiensis]